MSAPSGLEDCRGRIDVAEARRAVEDCAYPDEFLQALLQAEQARLTPRLVCKFAGVDSELLRDARGAAVTYVALLCDRLQQQSECLFQAVVQLDAYLDLVLEHAEVDGFEELKAQLPDVCTALCMIACKFESSTYQLDWSELTSACRWYKQSTTQDDDDEATRAAIVAAELRVLEVLDWRVDLPTAEQWLAAFCARFAAATNGVFGTLPQWIFQRGVMMCKAITPWYSTADLPPRLLAIGLFCSGFAAAGVLPIDALRPAAVDTALWTQIFVASNGSVPPTCVVSGDGQRRALVLLQLATRSEVAEMQECSKAIVASTCVVLERATAAAKASTGAEGPVSCSSHVELI